MTSEEELPRDKRQLRYLARRRSVMSNFNDYLKEQLNDPEFKKEYDALEPELSIIQAMIDARKASGSSQKRSDRICNNSGSIV